MGYVWQRWLADALRAEGCKVKEVDGWKNRGRPASSGQFEPFGTLWHHTATTTSYSNPNPTLNLCINGRSDLPGPLCQVLIGYDGTCHVIAAGRANHGGEHSGFGPFPRGDCNAMMMGWEIDYNGSQPMSPQQKDAAARASAACLKRWKKDQSYVAIHKETSVTGKWDTGGVPGDEARRLTKQQLEGDDDMPLSKEDIERIAAAVWAYGTPVYEGEEGEKKAARVVLGQTHNRAGDARDYAKKAAAQE